MKNLLSLRLPLLFCAAMGGVNLTPFTELKAQNISFEYEPKWQEGDKPHHRAYTTWADFNNDSRMDYYYGGTGMNLGWSNAACFAMNNGNGFTVNAIENKDMKSAYSRGSVAFDYNQDGFVDLLIQSRGNDGMEAIKEFLLIVNQDGELFMPSDAVSSLLNEHFWYWDNSSGSDVQKWSWGTPFNGGYDLASIAIGDYDKDGYPDILIMGKTTKAPDEDRITKPYVALLHNDGGKGFTKVDAGLAQKSEAGVEFADFNNDGWPDILIAGGEYMAGEFHLYLNNQNGTFTEVAELTDKYIVQQGSMLVLDLNQDGKMDFVLNGFVEDKAINKNYKRHCVAFLNNFDGTNLSFTSVDLTVDNQTQGVLGTNEAFKKCLEYRDFNGDGWVDFIVRGWGENAGGDWGFSSSKGDTFNNFELKCSGKPNDYWCDEWMSFGDVDGDYLAEALSINWWEGKEEPEGVRFSRNTTAGSVTLPDVPQISGAVYNKEKNNITLSWNGVKLPGSNGHAMYNVYIKNQTTGKTHMLVAANAETGFQKAYASFAAYDLAETYTFENVTEPGIYTVGVQSVSYSYAASAFATKTIAVLDENMAVEIKEDATDAAVCMTRTLKAGQWNTFCVPFSMTAEQVTEAGLGEVRELAGITPKPGEYQLNFTTVEDGIKAGKAYLVKPAAAVSTISLDGVTLSKVAPADMPVDDVTFIGTYVTTTINKGEFFIKGNAFYCADTDVTVKGYRAYITLPAEAAGVNRMTVNLDDVTGVEAVAADADRTVDVYNLSGVRVKENVKAAVALEGLAKGVYIVDGKKIIK